MKKRPALSKGELEVARVLWELGEATVGQVREGLTPKKSLAYTTVLSAMQKLEKAGWLRHRSEGRTYVYRPRRSRKEAGTNALAQFTHRVFDGAPVLLFEHLIDNEQLSDEELARLRKMIDRRRKEQRND